MRGKWPAYGIRRLLVQSPERQIVLPALRGYGRQLNGESMVKFIQAPGSDQSGKGRRGVAPLRLVPSPCPGSRTGTEQAVSRPASHPRHVPCPAVNGGDEWALPPLIS